MTTEDFQQQPATPANPQQVAKATPSQATSSQTTAKTPMKAPPSAITSGAQFTAAQAHARTGNGMLALGFTEGPTYQAWWFRAVLRYEDVVHGQYDFRW